MTTPTWSADFWRSLDQLLAESEIVIDRPKGSAHPRFPERIYPLDYGYLKNSSSMDNEGIDLWIGSQDCRKICGVAVTIVLTKRDSEIKLLIGVTPSEVETILRFLNFGQMHALAVPRDAT